MPPNWRHARRFFETSVRSQLPQYRAQVLHRLPRLRQLDNQQAGDYPEKSQWHMAGTQVDVEWLFIDKKLKWSVYLIFYLLMFWWDKYWWNMMKWCFIPSAMKEENRCRSRPRSVWRQKWYMAWSSGEAARPWATDFLSTDSGSHCPLPVRHVRPIRPIQFLYVFNCWLTLSPKKNWYKYIPDIYI